jgi:hypothetical protein
MSKRSRLKSRTGSERFVRLDHSVLYSPAYRALSPNGRALLWELIGLYNGYNNGRIFLSVRDAAPLMGIADPCTAGEAFRELVAHGFIRNTEKGSFTLKARHASAWRLTLLPVHDQLGPTNDFRGWRPEIGSRPLKRLGRLLNCKLRKFFSPQTAEQLITEAAKALQKPVPPVGNTPTANVQEAQKSVELSVVQFPTQIICHSTASERGSFSACQAARHRAKLWIGQQSTPSKGRLASLAGIHPSKLSRFLNCPTGRRTLLKEELTRLFRVTASVATLRSVQ